MARPDGAIAAALALVAAVFVLVSPGTWLVTDQAEYLYAAGRLLDPGTLVLGTGDDPALREALPWLIRGDAGPVRSRLLPLSALTEAPLAWLDRVLGWDAPPHRGRLVHFQGLAFVVGGLGVLAAACRRAGASARATAAAVVLVGATFPAWWAARHSGPEAILFLLVAAWCWADAAETSATPGAHAVRAGVLALAPWTNPTGTLIAGCLVASHLVRPPEGVRRNARRTWTPAVVLAASLLVFVVVWNHGYHGSWWAGGYDAEGSAHRFGERGLAWGLALHLGTAALESLPLVAVAAWGWAVAGGQRARPLPAVFVTVGLALLFATFYLPEPTRRLAPVWPAWGVVAGRSLDRLAPPRALLATAIGLGFVVSLARFVTVDGRYYPGPGGLYYPSVVWVELALRGHALAAGVVALALLLVAVRAGCVLWRRWQPATGNAA